MESFLKSYFFWTKWIPTVYFSVILYLILDDFDVNLQSFFILTLLFIALLLNLFLKKHVINIMLGGLSFMTFPVWIYCAIWEYAFDDGFIMPIILRIFGIIMGILLWIPLKRKQIETSSIK